MTVATPKPIALESIGWVSCAATNVCEVPSEGLPSDVVLFDHYVPALEGIEVGDHMYVIALFDQADASQLNGSTGTSNQQGAFSIRSSARPNRIGMTLARVTAIDGPRVSFDWLDFSDGSPVLDLKRYNWRWECVLSARRLDRRFIESQVDRDALAHVLARAGANFHGELCDRVQAVGGLCAEASQAFGIWLGDPGLKLGVEADGHTVDALQGITGATLGNGRLTVTLSDEPAMIEFVADAAVQRFAWRNGRWSSA